MKMKRIPAMIVALALILVPFTISAIQAETPEEAEAVETTEEMSPYIDVDTGYTYYTEIKWAHDMGYVEDRLVFLPTQNLTRESLYTIRGKMDGLTFPCNLYAYYTGTGLISVSEEEAQQQTDVNGSMDYYFSYPATAEEIGAAFPSIAEQAKAYMEENGRMTREEFVHLLYVDIMGADPQLGEVSTKEYPITTAQAGIYSVNSSGQFARTGYTDIRTIEKDGKTYYDLADVAGAIGNETTVEQGFSETYFHITDGDYYTGTKVYDVAVTYIRTADGMTYDIYNSHVEIPHDGSITSYTLSDCFVADGDVYLDGPSLRTIYCDAIEVDGGLRILAPDSAVPSLTTNSFPADSEQSGILTSSLWLLYNAWEDGYNIVMSNARSVKAVSQDYLTGRTGSTYTKGYADEGSNHTVFVLSDLLVRDTTVSKASQVETFAPLLVHESTHYQQFAKGDFSEDITVLNQAKACWYINQLGSMTDISHTLPWYNEGPEYDVGNRQATQWAANQGHTYSIAVLKAGFFD